MGSLDLVFHGIHAYVKGAHTLRDVYGAVMPGQLMAVMGPSGAGKTTLLNTLTGRVPLRSGAVTLNGCELNKDLGRKICYVLQDDIFFPTLTLHETLTFACMMRLPDEIPVTSKLEKMETLIDDLDLRKCLNTPMGGPWMPGLSGGERKRASIACELITDPAVILLDEPTSGLDYKTAFHLMKVLQTFARQRNKTVVMTIHQPASQIFLQFDLLLLMCDGHSVYYGPPSDVTECFAEAGYPMAPHYNPADFILEKLKESSAIKETIIRASYRTRQVMLSEKSEQKDSVVQGLAGDLVDSENIQGEKCWNRLPWRQIEEARKSHLVGKSCEDTELDSLIKVDVVETPTTHRKTKWPTGFLTQYKYLTIRGFRLTRSRLVDKSKIFESVFMCAVLSLIWFQLPRSEDTLRDRMGLIFYISMTWGFTPLFEAVTTYPQEKGVLHKERTAGWYRLSAYYLARFTCELPLILVHPVLWLTVVYWVTGLNNMTAFFATIGTLFVHAVTGQSIGLCVAIYTTDMRRGISSSTVIIMFTMLLGGFYTRNLPFWLDWSKYLSFLFYTFHCLLILEFTGNKKFLCAEVSSSSESSFQSCLSTNVTNPTIPSEEVLMHYGIEQPYWHYFLPLFVFLIVARLTGYIMLRVLPKAKMCSKPKLCWQILGKTN